MSLIPARLFDRLLAAVLLLAAGTALGRPPIQQPDNLIDDSFTMQAGLNLTSNSSRIRFDSGSGVLGTVIDPEQQLGMPSRRVLARAEVALRMRERHRIRLTDYYLPLDRDGTAVLRAPLRFGEPPAFAAGQTVDSKLNIRMLALTYTYSFIKTKRIELGTSLGVDLISAEGVLTSRAPARTARSEGSGATPLVGFDSTVRLNRRFYLESRVQIGRFSSHNVRERLTAYDVDVLYRVNPNVTFGFGFSGLDATVESRRTGNPGRLDLITRGPQLFARVGF